MIKNNKRHEPGKNVAALETYNARNFNALHFVVWKQTQANKSRRLP